MANLQDNDTDGTLLHMAWNLLWKQGSPYYLPNIMANGITQGSITIPPLKSVDLPKFGPFTLFNEPVLGYISISMDQNNLTGLPTITNGGLNYDETTKIAIITIGFGNLSVSGNYEVDSGGITGCAIASANGILNMFGSAKALVSEDDGNIDLAYQYRDKLENDSNGQTLVNIYYEHNGTIDTVVNADNSVIDGKSNPYNGMFRNQWQTADTKSLADTTSNAANNPDDIVPGFNDDTYNDNSFYLEALMVTEAYQGLYKTCGDQRGLDLFNAIKGEPLPGSDTSFEQSALNYEGPNKVNGVMSAVQSGNTSQLSKLEENEEYFTAQRRVSMMDRAYHRAEKFAEKWVATNRSEDYKKGYESFVMLKDPISQITGTFTDSFNGPSFAISVQITSSGDSITAQVTDITATVPQPSITLKPNGSSDLNTKVQNAVANASFITALIAQKIQSQVNTDDVKQYFTNRLNDAINKIFG